MQSLPGASRIIRKLKALENTGNGRMMMLSQLYQQKLPLDALIGNATAHLKAF
jgi:hypothetical protein